MAKFSTGWRGRRHSANKTWTLRVLSRKLFVDHRCVISERLRRIARNPGALIGWRSREVARYSNFPAYR